MAGKRLFFAVLCICVLLVSCRPADDITYTSLKISIADGIKTIMPDSALLQAESYTLNGTGPDGEELGEMLSFSGNFLIYSIRCGLWNFSARACNSEGKVLSSGSKSIEIRPGTGTATVRLTEIEGRGSLSLALRFADGTVFADTSGISAEISLYDAKRDSRIVQTYPVLRSDLALNLTESNLSAGSYEVSAVYYRDSEVIASAIDAVRIIGDTLTEGTIGLTLDPELYKSISLVIEDDTGAPVSGTIDAHLLLDKKTGQQRYSLVFIPENLPRDVSAEDLRFRWYCDGERIANGSSVNCEISPPADVSVTLLVDTRKDGSLSSFRINLKALPQIYIADDNPDINVEIPKNLKGHSGQERPM